MYILSECTKSAETTIHMMGKSAVAVPCRPEEMAETAGILHAEMATMKAARVAAKAGVHPRTRPEASRPKRTANGITAASEERPRLPRGVSSGVHGMVRN